MTGTPIVREVQFLTGIGAPSSEVAWGGITCYHKHSSIVVAGHTDAESFGAWPDRLCKDQISAKWSTGYAGIRLDIPECNDRNLRSFLHQSSLHDNSSSHSSTFGSHLQDCPLACSKQDFHLDLDASRCCCAGALCWPGRDAAHKQSRLFRACCPRRDQGGHGRWISRRHDELHVTNSSQPCSKPAKLFSHKV